MKDERGRDAALEHLLRRGVAARPASPAPGACLDGETLAAWSSGALASVDAARVEQHVSDCARCQSMLAAFVRTAPISATPAPWWQRAHVRWLVPLATAATVAGIWVAMPQRDRPVAQPAEMRDRVETGQRFEPGAPAASPGVQTAPGTAQGAAGKPESAPAAAKPESVPGVTKPESAPVAATRGPGRDARARADSRERREKVGDTAARQSGRRVGNEAAAAAPTAPAPPPPVAESVTVTGQSPLAAAAAGVEFASPGGTTRWRIASGQVQRSTNQGASWEAVTLPSDRTVTSGHSPSPSVAWLVGKAGAVFVTTDGAQFEPVPFVSSVDVVSIVAVDDQEATVTTADGRRLRTTNRGRTWSQP